MRSGGPSIHSISRSSVPARFFPDAHAEKPTYDILSMDPYHISLGRYFLFFLSRFEFVALPGVWPPLFLVSCFVPVGA